MTKSTVYFSDLRTSPSINLPDKLERLVRACGMERINFNKKLTAIKIHFGEPGNLAFIRPNYPARLVRLLKDLGAIPFLTDTNTLYHGRRSNAPDHLDAAYENGFTPLSTGCQVIIADGIRGIDYEEISTGLQNCPTARIASSIANAEVIISMNHFKGHEMMGFGGVIKNLGMGCASVGGKLEMHSTSTPEIKEENCTGCRLCEKYCAYDAIKVGDDSIATIDKANCVGCGQCIATCQFDAARVVWEAASELASMKVAEYAYAAVMGKPHFHISFMIDIAPECDCWRNNDAPIVPDIGIAASFDPVALDLACADMVKDAPALPGTMLTDKYKGDLSGKDKFSHIHSNSNWKSTIYHAAECGLGNMEYEVVRI